MPEDDQDIFKASTGVELRIKTPSVLVIQAALKGMGTDEPKVPSVYSKDKERDELNPNDPEYIAAMQRWQMETGVRGFRALIPTGTELVSKPSDMTGPEDEDFPDLMDAMGVEVPSGAYTRYVQWVMLVACTGEDLNELGNLLLRRIGVSEEDVAAQVTLFRGTESRGADNADLSDRRDRDRDNLPAADAGSDTPV